MKISVLMPVYNEEQTIARVVERVIAADVDKEIVLIDDGSHDASLRIARELAEKHGQVVQVIAMVENSGKGAAVSAGVQAASGEMCLIQDADLEYDPNDYERLIAPVLSGEAQIVYGTRFAGNNKLRFTPSVAANRFLTFLTNLLFGSRLTDMETCHKLIPTRLLRRLEIESQRFDIEPEITAKLLLTGHTIHEVPVSYQPRSYDEGKKIGWRDGIEAVATLLRWRIRGFRLDDAKPE